MSMRYQAGVLTASYFPLKTPDAPTIGTATAGSSSASVTFTAPSNVGGGAITGYFVVASPGGAFGSGASSPVTVSGLTNGTAYTFKAYAVNAYGSGPLSASSNSVTPQPSIDFLVVAGGGGGGSANGGGGGAGGYQSTVAPTGGGGTLVTALTLALATNYTVTIGAGGTGSTGLSGTDPTNGSDSVFNTVTSLGGGRGGNANPTSFNGATGGSGGGGNGQGNPTAGSGTANQGYNGGAGQAAGGDRGGGGGGGAGAVGVNASSPQVAGAGGAGLVSTFDSVQRGGGGGGGSQGTFFGAGGAGGGGRGASSNANNAVDGTANTGGGGGGGPDNTTSGAPAKNGGSGVVVLRYSDTLTITIGAGLTGTTSSPSGGFKVTTITAGTGNVQWN